MADLIDVIDEQLKEYAARVRASMPPPPLMSAVPRQRRAVQALVAAAAVTGIVTTSAVLASTRHADQLRKPAASRTPSSVPTVTRSTPTPPATESTSPTQTSAPTESTPTPETVTPVGRPALRGTATTAQGLTVSADGSHRETAPRAAASSFELMSPVYADASGRVYAFGRECGKAGCVKTLRITNDGNDWRDLSLATPAESPDPVSVDAVGFTDAQHGYLSLSGGTFRTSDGGRTWDRISREAYVGFQPAGDLVYAYKFCSADNCVVSHVVLDGNNVRRLPAADLPQAGGIQPAGGSMLYLSEAEKLLVSTDGGQTWTRHNPPCNVSGSGRVSASAPAPGAWFICDGRLFGQDSPAGAWIERTAGLDAAFAGDYAADRVNPQFVTSYDGVHAYATLLLGDVSGDGRDMQFGLATTADGGATWQKATLGRIVIVTPTGPTSAVALFEPPAGRCSDPTCIPPMSVARTTDGGRTWTELAFPS